MCVAEFFSIHIVAFSLLIVNFLLQSDLLSKKCIYLHPFYNWLVTNLKY